MFWLQGIVAFLVWIGYGFYQSRRSGRIRDFARRRPAKGITAAGLLVAAVLILFFGLNTVHSLGGFTSNGMTLIAWFAVIVVGLAFVHLQTLALAIIVTMAQEAVTADRRSASTSQEHQKESDETDPI